MSASWSELISEVSLSERLTVLLFVAVPVAVSVALSWATLRIGRRWTR